MSDSLKRVDLHQKDLAIIRAALSHDVPALAAELEKGAGELDARSWGYGRAQGVITMLCWHFQDMVAMGAIDLKCDGERVDLS